MGVVSVESWPPSSGVVLVAVFSMAVELFVRIYAISTGMIALPIVLASVDVKDENCTAGRTF